MYMRSAILYPWMPPCLIAEGVDWGHSGHHKTDGCSDLKACSFNPDTTHFLVYYKNVQGTKEAKSGRKAREGVPFGVPEDWPMALLLLYCVACPALELDLMTRWCTRKMPGFGSREKTKADREEVGLPGGHRTR